MAVEPEKDAATIAGQIRSPDPLDASRRSPHNVTILVCSTCRNAQGDEASPTPGEQLFAATCAVNKAVDGESGQPPVRVLSIECLGNCKRRLSASIVTNDCWTYVFGDLTLENAGDLVTGARLMIDTPNGLMPWRGRPSCLKTGMVARVPPLSQ